MEKVAKGGEAVTRYTTNTCLTNKDKDFYRVWFEYLIRTPAYLHYDAWMERIYAGEDVPWPKDLDRFCSGYGEWWNHDRPWEFTFDRCWWRLKHRQRMSQQAEQNAFTPAAEIGWYARQELAFEREDAARALTFEEEGAIVERVADFVLNDRHERETAWRNGFRDYRYKGKPAGVKAGSHRLAVLKRRLTYYHLEKILGFSRERIIRGEIGEIELAGLPFPELAGPPFGNGSFSPDSTAPQKTVEVFRYWLSLPGLPGWQDPPAFLSEEVSEAGKVIRAVEDGWFPAPPPELQPAP